MTTQKHSYQKAAFNALLLLGALLLITPAATTAQDRNLRFEQLSLEDGLSQSYVNTVFQDSRGFMWFGTEDGLNRYDGRSFTIFKHDTEDPSSLSHNFIWDVLEDRNGSLWVGTNGGGLDRWDGNNSTFVHFKNNPANPQSLSHDRVRVLFEDREGVLWIGTDGGGLNQFDSATQTFRRFSHDPSNPDSLTNDRVRAIHQDRDGILWIGTYGGGLNKLDPKTLAFVHHRPEEGDAHPLCSAEITAIHETPDGAIWAGTYGDGAYRINRQTDEIDHFTSDPDRPTSLTSNSVHTIFQDSTATLWFGTEDGLSEWRPETGKFARYTHSATDPKSLGANGIHSIFQDRGGVLWIGTKGGGLSKWNALTGSFPHYRKDASVSTSLSANQVSSFYEDTDGMLWIGTYGGGLNRFDRQTGTYTHYSHDPDDPSSLSDDRVMSLMQDSHGDLWAGTMTGGLNRLNRETGLFTRFQNNPEDPKSITRDGIMTIFEDSQGTLWIGTFEGGLNRFDRATESFTHYVNDPAIPTSLSGNRVTKLYEDHDGVLWVGTDGGGLNRFDRATGTFTHFRHDPEDATSLSSDVVFSMHEDRSGALWIGTLNGGLNRWDAEDRRVHRGVFEHFTERDGLPNDVIYGIVADHQGNLWMSTNMGLSKLNLRTQIFKNYDVTHGLQSNEFNFGSYYRNPDGELFFGGINGFNAFYPSQILDNAHVPPVVLTSIRKANREIDLDRPVWEAEEIEVSYRDHVVSIEFAALDYTAPEQNHYAYMLEGFDDDWIELGTLQRATYTNLPAGTYTFRVRGSNNDLVWSEQGASLTVRAIPPPWKTWWAYSLYMLALVAVVYAYVRAQTRKLEREEDYSRRLENQVQERTRELAKSNEDLKLVNLKLQEASLTDSLTGLRNRRYLMTHIQEDLSLVERQYKFGVFAEGSDRRLSKDPDFLFVMIDLDGLKELNDLLGHSAGDLAIVQMREILQNSSRDSDTIIRWGGDEFMVVGRGVDRDHGETLAERIRSSVESHPFELGLDEPVHLTCSVGFAFYPFLSSQPTLLSGEQVIRIADRALYLAKTSGRNAWVGIFSTDKTPDDANLPRTINNDLEGLTSQGFVELQTSIPDPAQLVWERA
jgi:diguanylate cyclase (GGDEF)-like protein